MSMSILIHFPVLWRRSHLLGFSSLNLRIEAIPISKVPRETFKWIFDLLKTNMESFYEQTWGWSDSGKRNELKEGAALYLIGM